MLRRYRIAIIVFIISVIVGLAIGLPLPADAQIPTHWNIKGEIDGYAGKTVGLIMLPGITLLLLLFFIFFPYISPRYRNQEHRFKKLLPLLASIMVVMFSSIHLLSLMVARNAEFNGSELLWLLLGIMFILLGNLFPKLPSSFFIGIRTPWTLSSENVWRRTHLVGGRVFVIGGIFFVLAGVTGNLLGIETVIFYILLGLMVVYPLMYSFIDYRREMKKNHDSD